MKLLGASNRIRLEETMGQNAAGDMILVDSRDSRLWARPTAWQKPVSPGRKSRSRIDRLTAISMAFVSLGK